MDELVGRLLVSMRKRQGLTQVQLADRAGTSQPVISAYEHSRRDPSVATLRRLVEAGGERLSIHLESPKESPMTPGGDEEHGRRLVQLLHLADAIPRRRRTPELRAPRLESR